MIVVLLTATALILAIGLALSPRYQGTRALLTSRNIVLGLFAVYILLPGILAYAAKGDFTWAPAYSGQAQVSAILGIALLALLGFMAGAAIQPKPLARKDVVRADNPRPHLAYLLVAIGLAIKLYVVSSTGGLNSTVSRLSSAVQSSVGVADLDSASIMLTGLSAVADAGAVWLVVDALKRRTSLIAPSLVFIFVFIVTFLSVGKRLTLIFPIIAVLVAIHVFRKRITVRMAPVAIMTVVGLGMITLLGRIFIPASASGVSIDLTQIPYAQGSILRFYFYSLEFANIEMIAVIKDSGEDIHRMFKGAFSSFLVTNIEPFLYGVPRAIWPGKPELFTDVSYAVAATLNGTSIDGATAGYATTLIGTAYLFGGSAMVVVVFAGLGILVRYIDRMLESFDWTVERVFVFALILTAVFQFFRQGSLGWTAIVVVVQQYGIVLGLFVISLANKKVNRPVESAEVS